MSETKRLDAVTALERAKHTLDMLGALNTPTDPVERRAAKERYDKAQAEYLEMLSAPKLVGVNMSATYQIGVTGTRAGDELLRLWKSLSSQVRLELCGMCCHGCGSLNIRCQCQNDE